ncbi:MAG TPA: sigma-70 family RNA polymerase sigma factor [Kofleriaceae bacterium]|nr:sigma-70 family RNA polymerase sigma factor [Kofleriaceae bacterium]
MTAASARRTEPLDDLTVRRAQRGDEQAWRALIARYQQPVHALIWRLLAGRHRVEDLVQETFVRVLRALPSFDLSGSASLASWIFTIATRLALNELRRPELATTAPDDAPASRADRADHQAERHQLATAIAGCIAALPETQRAVLVLREYHDLPYGEIAGILELDVGTVKSRLGRARLAVREALIARMPEAVPARPAAKGGRHGAR